MSYTLVTDADIGDGVGRTPSRSHGSDFGDPDTPFRAGYINLCWDLILPDAASPPPEESRPPSPLRTGIIVAAMIAAAAWIALGDDGGQPVYDGWFHTVNGSCEDHDVALAFPSGERREFHLDAKASAGFRVDDAGEGALAVTVDGGAREEVGHLNPSDGAAVAVVGVGRTGFFRIFSEDGD